MRGEGLARATESRLTGRLVREPRDMVMIGDQLESGVRGARAAHIDSASQPVSATAPARCRTTYARRIVWRSL